jgi:competence protein ComEC
MLLRMVFVAATPPHPSAGDPALLLPEASGSLPISLEGRLLADPSPIGTGKIIGSGTGQACRALLQLPSGRTELRFRLCPELQQGWHVRATGQLKRPQPSPHPLLAAPAERLARQGVFSQLQVEELQVLGRLATPIADLRRRMAATLLEQAGAARGGVLAALVLGSAVVPVPLEVRDAFRAAGLSHALAASGFHLSVLLGAVMPLGRRLGRPLRLALAFGAMGLFVLLAGPQPSVLRAVLMGAIALVILEGGWRAKPIGILVASVVALLLVVPGWLLDVGFQLSVMATAGLMVSARPLEQALRNRLPKLVPGWFAGALAVPLAASLWTLPLQLLHFGVVPSYAVPANLVVTPLLTPITLGAMVLACLAVLVPPLVPLLSAPVAWLCGVLLAVVRWFAGLPMAQWQLGKASPGLVLLFSLALAALVLPGFAPRWRRLGQALLALVMALHLGSLCSDRLLLVHQGRLDVLVARHQGRGALVSLQGDGFSCQAAQNLAKGLGLQRLDWSLVLDPVPPTNPDCWHQNTAIVLTSGEGTRPLEPGETLASPGLAAAAVASDSRGVQLQIGRAQWLLLPDRQALWSWRDQRDQPMARPTWDGVWLGFRPGPRESEWLEGELLQRQGAKRVWLSGDPPRHWPRPWAASGASGSLEAGLA